MGLLAAGLVDDGGVDALAALAPEPLAHQCTSAPLCQPQARRVRRVPNLSYAQDERRRRGAGLVEDKEMDDLTKLLDHKLKDLHYHPPAFHAAMPQPAQLLFDHPMFADVPDADFHAQARHVSIYVSHLFITPSHWLISALAGQPLAKSSRPQMAPPC
jgi:hypothetical protein